MLHDVDIRRLVQACAQLLKSKVVEEEAHVFESPILILMSTVLSLNRRWYSHALLARQRFEQGAYTKLNPKSLRRFQELSFQSIGDSGDWRKLAQELWNTREKNKAEQLARLVDYFVKWHRNHYSELEELQALQRWAEITPKESFVGTIKGLGPRACEQLLWYLQGGKAIKLDRHVTAFVRDAVGRSVSEGDTIAGLQEVARRMGLSATALDARIWDHMQGGARCGDRA